MLRLVLMNGFEIEEPAMTTMLKEIFTACPQLFQSLLPRSEMASLEEDPEEEDEEDMTDFIRDDELHQRPTATGRLQQKYCRTILKIPTRASETDLMSEDFQTKLTKAFREDYGMPHIIDFGKEVFQWCKRISFSSP